MKKRVFAAFLAVCMTMGITGCSDGELDGLDTIDGETEEGSDGLITIGFSQVGAESDWRIANTASMKEAFLEENGYELIYDDAQQNQENQLVAIRKFIQQEVDYILVAPVIETGWDAVLEEAKEAGIPVIVVDRMLDVEDDSLYTAWVGSNFALEGARAAEWIHQFLLKKGIENANIVNIQGTMGATAQIGRTEGLRKACSVNSNMTLLDEQTGEFVEAKAQEVMESYLKQYKDINIVYCENDNQAFGAINAIEAAGKKVGSNLAAGEIMVVSFDAANAGMTDVLEGKITLAMECNPLHGPRVESIIRALEEGREVEKTNYVDEEMYAHDDTVTSVTIDGTEYPVTVVTQEILDGRVY